MKTILKKQGKPEQLAGFKEEGELVLGDVALAVINEPQDLNLSLVSIILDDKFCTCFNWELCKLPR